MENRRVVITGMGVIAPNGIGIERFWDSLVLGQSAVRRITRFDASSYPSQIAAEVLDFDPTHYMEPKDRETIRSICTIRLSGVKDGSRRFRTRFRF